MARRSILDVLQGSEYISVKSIKANLYDEPLLQKFLTAKSRYYFRQNTSFIDVQLGCKYASASNLTLLTYYIWVYHKV